jgi:hypothetical protein
MLRPQSLRLQPTNQREIKTTSQLHFCIVSLKSETVGTTVYIYVCVCVCQYKRRKPTESNKYMINKIRVKLSVLTGCNILVPPLKGFLMFFLVVPRVCVFCY